MFPKLWNKALTILQPKMGKHHLMVGTWTPPGAIFSFEFDDETLELNMIKRTEIPKDEPISWMALSVSAHSKIICMMAKIILEVAQQESHLWRQYEEMVIPCSKKSYRDLAYCFSPHDARCESNGCRHEDTGHLPVTRQKGSISRVLQSVL
jgi:hypothetical protein